MKLTLNFKKIFFLFLYYFILGKEISICQNLVSNPSFEIGEAGKPDNGSQLKFCTDWIDFNSTPDWYTSKNFAGALNFATCPTDQYPPPGTSSIKPHSGEFFASFWPDEGVQNKLKVSVKKNTLVKVSFWASPGTQFQTELKVYLCNEPKTADDYGANGFNYPNDQDFIDETFLVYSFSLNSNKPEQSPCDWRKYESDWVFVPPITLGDGNLEYDALLIISTPESGYSKYIYIDDIRLENINACDHPCGPQGTTVIEKLPNVFTPNADGVNDTWNVVVSNAVKYDLVIYDRWGSEIFRNKSEVPNGMNHYKISWDGKFTQTGDNPCSVFYFILNLWDCNGNLTTSGSDHNTYWITMYPCPPSTISSVSQDHINTPYFRSDCCLENLDLNNVVIQNSFTYNVAHIINIENVTVKSGAHVIFNAGDEINRDAETEFEFGSTVEENIQACIPDLFAPDGQNQSRMARVQEPTDISKPAVPLVSEKLPNVQSIYPVPANDEIIITLSLDLPSAVSLNITDLTGKTNALHHKKYFESAGVYSYRINTSHLSNGIYLYHLTGEGISKAGKLVVVR